ncbi:MAG: pantetheine-phosphate adenylyltransferase [Campylobacterales bacterium]|nr:pantetheine-phosphate adenylyltransferase [Campylobacterales bacterium]
MSVKKAIYSGTFDPITNGHMDIIKRGLKIYDTIIIAVADSRAKNPMFDLDTRVNLIQKATKDLGCVEVIAFRILLADLAKDLNVYHIIRGLRTTTDFEYELQMSYANSSLEKKLETIFLMPSLENAFVSSSVVRELLRFNGKFDHLVPSCIYDDICMYKNKGV